MTPSINPQPQTPEAVRAIAQSRGGQSSPEATAPIVPEAGESTRYRISRRVELAKYTQLYERRADEPLYRPLQIYALNPAVSRLEGALAITRVQYEPLEPGPKGSVIEVSSQGVGSASWGVANLEDPFVLMQSGYTPSLSEPRFHQQMVYAVAMMTYNNFKVALGRNVAWAFSRLQGCDDHNRLLLRPHGAEEANAWYDRETGEIVFGYFKARRSTPVAQAGEGYVFTSVSHDVIAHEMSHALLDGLRSHFLVPSHQDVLAFHEAFADLVAFFQHFTFEGVVRAAIGKSRGNLQRADLLVEIAQEFGQGLGGNERALRTLADLPDEFVDGDKKDPSATLLTYAQAGTEPHDLGRVLARAIFAAFLRIYKQRSSRYIKLATNGTGELPAGDLSNGLQEILVSEVRRLAEQFLSICIRAIDYCPPVDIRFGDYLRALITADSDVVPDDTEAYRETIIRAFGERGLYGEGTRSMTEDALTWGGPRMTIEPAAELSFGRMQFDGDPAMPVSVVEMRRQAGALGRLVCHPRLASEFGLVSPESEAFQQGEYQLPIVESVRSARRVGPDRQVVFDTVAEVVQSRRVRRPDGSSFVFYGGSTIILGPRGEVRFVIRKRVDHEERPAEQIEFMQSETGNSFWTLKAGEFNLTKNVAKRLCVRAFNAEGCS